MISLLSNPLYNLITPFRFRFSFFIVDLLVEKNSALGHHQKCVDPEKNGQNEINQDNSAKSHAIIEHFGHYYRLHDTHLGHATKFVYSESVCDDFPDNPAPQLWVENRSR